MIGFRPSITLLTCLASLAVLGPGETVRGDVTRTFHVSPAGDDAKEGTQARPFATIQRARDAVRQLRAKQPEADVTIVLHGGVYYLRDPLVLGPEDSGTARHPVVWRAAQGDEVVLSGGRPITSKWAREDANIWKTTLPEAVHGNWYFRILRVGDHWAIRARYPNFDPKRPYTGGWLFAKPVNRSDGAFGSSVANIHNRGDMMEWNVDIPATGEYNVYHYYAARNKPWGTTNMGGRCIFTVDDREPVVLQNLQDTGSFRTFTWSARNAVLRLTAGKHTIRWTNTLGGGISYDAFALCDDPDWTPRGTPPVPPAAGKHLVIVQGETFVKSKGRELTTSQPASRRYFGFADGELKEWTKPDEIEMHVFPAWGWVSSIEPIAQLDLKKGVATIAGREASQEIRVGNRYFLENIPEELDSVGEWYLDRETGVLRYWPEREDFRELQIVAPVMDRIIHIKGTPGDGSSAGHIQLIGLTFKDTSYTPRIDSPYNPPDAAVWIEDATDCLIEACRFTCTGGSALKLVGDARENLFLDNTVERVGQNGVFMVGGPGDKPFPHGNTVAGCTMRHIGLVYKHVGGVYVGRRDPSLADEPGNLIAHNLITDCPRYAVGIKMNQGNHVVEFNEIRRTNLETNDTGAIESCVRNREAPGNVYRHNLVMDTIGLKHTPDGKILTPYYSWGIYMDDDSSHARIHGNICVREYRSGVHIHGGQKNVIENNIFVGGHLQEAEFNNIRANMVGNVFRRNICVRLEAGGQMLRSGGWNKKVLAECDRNLYWSTAEEAPLIFPGKSLEQWRGMGYGAKSIIADPLFEDMANDDYRLKANSPAWQLGFERIPVERIGLKGYRRASYLKRTD